ncbi:MAG TPA: glycosyl hydrolase family 18 protein, partial [Acidobacteriota bacterium]|nr:glycosyl hydrolase family 18 protein [Acidobacteriota bacterium]
MLVLLRFLFFSHPAMLPAYLLLTNVPSTQEMALTEDPGVLRKVDRTKNAAWLEHRWFQPGVTQSDLDALSKRLAANKIHYLYPHLTPSDASGHLPQYSAESVRKFATKMRHDIPGIQILPWVGGIQKGYKQTSAGTLDFDSPAMRDAFAADCASFIEKYHLDGIHLNIEPVESGDARFVEWLGAIKKRIGDRKVLSVAAAKPSIFEGLNVAPLRAWDLDYFVSVGRKCDQLVIMNYDTSFNSQLLYSLFTEDKLTRLLTRFSQ